MQVFQEKSQMRLGHPPASDRSFGQAGCRESVHLLGAHLLLLPVTDTKGILRVQKGSTKAEHNTPSPLP